jgi:PAS domain S-box-containing protein
MNIDKEIDKIRNFKFDDIGSELRLSDILNFIPDAAFIIDPEGKVIIWNDSIEKLTGIKKEDILGKDNFEYSIPFYNTRRPILIDYVLHPELDIENIYPVIRKENNVIYCETFTPSIGSNGAYLWCTAKPLYGSSGKLIGAIESIRDLSELKKADGIINKLKDELFTVNSELSAAVSELKTKNTDNTDFETAKIQLLQVREELLKSNELLKASEEKFSKAFKNSPVVISLSTVSDGVYVDVSDNFYSETGWTKDEVIGHTSNHLNIWVDDNDRNRVIKEMKENGTVRELEIKFRKKNGEIRTKLFSGDIIVVGGVPCLLTMNSDITDRIKAEEENRHQKIELEKVNEELKKTIKEMETTHRNLLQTQKDLLDSNRRLLFSEEKFSKTVHLGPVVITLSRLADGVYVDASDYFLNLTGYSRDEVIGHSALDLNIWADTEDRDRVMTALKNDGLVRGLDISFCSRDGSVYYMNYSAEAISIAGEMHLVSVAVDVTERKKAEDEKLRLEHQLQQSQKMETVGRLAGGIAHDFNNLLTAIMGNVELCMIRTGKESSIYQNLDMIKMASESAADLTKRILAFSRKQIIEPQIIDLNDTINHMQKMLMSLLGENIRLNTRTEAINAKIIADPGQIEQIILNLSVNARDAMSGEGTLTISSRNIILDDEYCRTHAYDIPGEYVMLSVDDTGSGMSDEVKKHLFEPFYTTKPKGKGTGLGLSMVYGSVKQNNGTIEVESAEGNGTCFKMHFPLYGGQISSSPGTNEKVKRFKGEETILFVEDNSMVIEFAVHILKNAGFRILEAQNAEEAQALESAYTEKIDLLISDVIMPGINGKVLAERLSRKRPDMKVILTSGYTENIIESQSLADGLNFISKPYSAGSLLKKIREVIDG